MEKVNRRRACRRREYRSFMRSLASEVYKKEGLEKLKANRELDRCMLIKCKGMIERARLIIKVKKRM